MKGVEAHEGRNWQEYNEFLVMRGGMYLTFDSLESWGRDLEKPNRGKLGSKLHIPGPLSSF
jgi:hypothetical protein